MKVAIRVEDVVKYDTEIVVEQPSYMSDAEFEEHLDNAEKEAVRLGNGTAKELEHALEQMGFHIVETTTGFPNSPDSVELEIIDVRNVKDEDD